MSTRKDILSERIAAVEGRLQAACQRSGRQRADVTLVAVTKLVPDATVALLPELGILDLGEGRPQELWRRAATLTTPVRWHLIGHLQRNKIERTLPLAALVHSVDSPRLLTALAGEAARLPRVPDVLLEVNAARDPNKQGFQLEDLPAFVAELATLKTVRVRGLMTMAALSDDPETSRPAFAALRALRDRLASEVPPPHEFRELSMGMSGDFEVAVEEGATLVRIGSVLFAGLPEVESGLNSH